MDRKCLMHMKYGLPVLGPDTPAEGERLQNEQHFQNQVAGTIAKLLSVTFDSKGVPVKEAFTK